ncbi:MAG: 3-dehydroquinate synthase [Acidobacteriota bacterium]
MSDIRVGNFFKDVSRHLKYPKVIIVTDKNVERIYGHYFNNFPKIIIGTGEKIKKQKTLKKIYEKFLFYEVDRETFIAGVGGGIVCDITGFAASTYLRGLKFGFFPTTLLAQADAAIGGKNGINLKGYKNLIGSFRQPDFVYSDLMALRTLSEENIRNGFAEIIKHGLIMDNELSDFLVENSVPLLKLEDRPLKKVINRSKEIKMGIVRKDELESGERKILNFGHTFGHAFEKITKISHGEAVAIGMVWAAEFSLREGLLSREGKEKVVNILKKFGLPVFKKFNGNKLKKIIRADKKRSLEYINFVFLKEPGVSVVKKTGFKKIEGFIDDMC